MKIHDFFNNIKYFSNEDFKLFDKFLLSPFFNNFKSASTVYRIIYKNLTFISDRRYEDLKTIIIKETKFSKETVRKILSNLNELYIKFVNVQAHIENKFECDIISCNYLLLKGNYSLLKKRVHLIENHLADSISIDEDIFLKLYEINILNYNILATSEDYFNPAAKIENQKRYTIESSKDLLIYALSKTTINFVNYVIQSNDSNSEKSPNYPINLEILFNQIINSESNIYSNIQITTANLFYKIYKAFNKILNDKYYDDYKDYYNKVKGLFNIEFHKTHTSILLGYSILRQRLSDKSKFYASETLLILFDFIENGFYKNDKTEYLHPLMYRNYVISCLNIEREDLLTRFIDNHSDKLHPSEILPMKKFALVHLYYLRKEYDKSLEHADFKNNPKFLYKYDIYNLNIKNCYELNNFETIEDILHNYRDNINRDEFLTKHDKERFYLLVYFMKKYLIAYYKYETKPIIFDFEYLLESVTKKPDFIMRNWFIKKLNTFISEHYKKTHHQDKDN